MKRFYTEAAIAAAAGGYTVVLDGKPMRTPARRPLAVPSEALARALACEWQAQGETITRETMPLTRLVCTAIDHVAQNRAGVVAETLNFARTDLVCYRAESPAELVRRQSQDWDPLLAWASERFGARLWVASGVVPVAQPETAVEALARPLKSADDLTLTALSGAVQASGSLVIALALGELRIGAGDAFELSQIDESFQIERWGEDGEQARRRAALARDLGACAAVIEALAEGTGRCRKEGIGR